MTNEQYFKNLTPPEGIADVVLDTDAYNEIDDQFALAYLLRYSDRLRVKGICAAPFFNDRAASPADGMEKSYEEIFKILRLAGREELFSIVKRGSAAYLADETTPTESDAADFMVNLAKEYSPERPLYIVAIGAITNVASALLKDPEMKDRCVVVWLGGNAVHMPNGASEFNMVQDIAAARVVMGCGVPFVQLPCWGVVDKFHTSGPELAACLKGKNALCDYLYENTCAYMEVRAKGRLWSKVIWDVVAVAWLVSRDRNLMWARRIPSPIPEYDKQYAENATRHLIEYVYAVNRDVLFIDMIERLSM